VRQILDVNLDEIISQLKAYPAPYQRDAVEFCLAGDETTVDRLLSELHNWRHSEDPNSDDFGAFPIYALHILGYLKETRLHSLLLEIANLPESHSVLENMGDYITERFHVELYRTCKGDFSGIRKTLLNPEAYVYARWACIKVLEAAAACGDISEESLVQELLEYVQHQLERYSNKDTDGYGESDYTITAALLSSLCDLDVTEQNELVQRAFTLDILDTTTVGLRDFKMLRSRGNENFKQLKKDVEATVHEAMEWWACFQPEKPSNHFPLSFERRVKSKSKKEKIGRNDPCPCGSGKKYKKCCLVQAI
jgi:Protein of unknown function (DUF1186)/SEC-C motif